MKNKKSLLELQKLRIVNLSFIRGGENDNGDLKRSEPPFAQCPPVSKDCGTQA